MNEHKCDNIIALMAGILTARILSVKYPEIREKLEGYILTIKENIVFDLEDKLVESWGSR